MICPDCRGRGRVRKRMLGLFTYHGRCAKCRGTGEFPPRETPRERDTRSYWDTDPSLTSDSRDRERDRDQAFDVGSGGRSGGGGGGSSWDEREAPVIADPFGGTAPGVESIAAAEAVSSDASSPGDASSSDSGSAGDSSAGDDSASADSDSGTSY